jgi:hypothetical protein
MDPVSQCRFQPFCMGGEMKRCCSQRDCTSIDGGPATTCVATLIPGKTSPAGFCQ